MTVSKAYHCAYTIHYHIVFPVKYHKALLNEEVTKYIKEIAQEIESRYFMELEKIGCDTNHIHLLCGADPKYAPGALVRVFKSVTAKKVFKQFPTIKKELWGGEFWSDGYYVATVGEAGNWKVVEAYVQNQGTTPETVQLRLL
ncbi:IS200/IS605 family transposase [Candidatus Roizmanbacteria bacterium]|nr:IS200/IS605 family transposase [Candidatus Roizmanbacteria bacterium]